MALLVALLVLLSLGVGHRPPRRPTPSARRRPSSTLAVAVAAVRRIMAAVRPTDPRQRALAALPELLHLMARSLRSGTSVLGAVTEASSSVPAAGLTPVVGRIRAGSTMAEALTRWADWLGHPDARLVVATLQLGDRMGAPMAPALDRTAAMLRQRATLTDELVSLSAQARASARVLALAPVGFATIVALADPATAGRLFATRFGRVSLAVGLVLDGLGLWWMRRLVSAVRP